MVTALVIFERGARRRRGYASDAQHPRPLTPHRLSAARGTLALAVGSVPVVIGFAAPAAYLLHATITRVRASGFSPEIVSEATNTIVVASLGTLFTMLAALLVVYAARLHRGPWPAALTRISSIGYAVPGVVLAIGLLPVVTGGQLILLTSGAAIVIAYAIRFLAIAIGGIEAGFSRVPASVDDAARTLGESPMRRLWRIHLPLTRPALATSTLLVFVDCMKELPATLLLRPVGFETLATHLYGDAVRGTYEDAAVAALLIVAVGVVPVLVLARVAETRYLDGW
jgi:iron(III) transport system permease protein